MRKKHKTMRNQAALRLFQVLYFFGITISAVSLLFLIGICVIRYTGTKTQDEHGAANVQTEATASPPAATAETQTPAPTPSPIPTAVPVSTPAPAPTLSPEESMLETKPSADDLDIIGSDIGYPKSESYLPEYRFGSINSPWGEDVKVYSFCYPRSMDNNERSIDLPHGTLVTVIAEENGFACVFAYEFNQACWVNAEYIEYW